MHISSSYIKMLRRWYNMADELISDCAVLQEWGVDLADMLTPSSATQAYVDFLTNIAETEVGLQTSLEILNTVW